MKTIAKENLIQLKELIQNISNDDFTNSTEVLSGATIGQHMRHILEFYLLLVSGSFSGTISYDKRERDIRIESDKEFAQKTIEKIIAGIDTLTETDSIYFEGDFTVSGNSNNKVVSSVARELAYCIEHSIHHQALIKAGLITLGLNDITDGNFGVAYSTLRYRSNTCAQ